jgi:hypothetical protein
MGINRGLSCALHYAVLGAIGVLVPTVANAECNGRWDLNGNWTFSQTNGASADFQFRESGGVLVGNGTDTSPGDRDALEPFGTTETGTVLNGKFDGSSFSFSIDWGNGSEGAYSGVVDDEGWLAGRTHDKRHSGSTAIWSSNRQARCIVAEVETPSQKRQRNITIKSIGKAKVDPAPAQPAAPDGRLATVTGDVDVYDVPGGGGNVIGMLRKGELVPFEGCQEDHWCKVTGKGWVWGDFLLD